MSFFAFKHRDGRRRELEAEIAGLEKFQKLVLEQPDDVILEFIKRSPT